MTAHNKIDVKDTEYRDFYAKYLPPKKTPAEYSTWRKSRHKPTPLHKPCSHCGETDPAKFGWYNICKKCKAEAKRQSRIRRGERVVGVDRRYKRS